MKNAERRQKLQRHELIVRMDWLKDHIKRAESVPVMAVAVTAWRRELMRKRQLLMELKAGMPVSDREVKQQTNVSRLLRSGGTGELEYITLKPGQITLREWD